MYRSRTFARRRARRGLPVTGRCPSDRQYDAWKAGSTVNKTSDAALRRPLNAIKRNAFPWMREVTKNAPQMALMPWGQAFKNFFAGIAEYPTVKKKGQHDSFTLTHDPFMVKGAQSAYSEVRRGSDARMVMFCRAPSPGRRTAGS